MVKNIAEFKRTLKEDGAKILNINWDTSMLTDQDKARIGREGWKMPNELFWMMKTYIRKRDGKEFTDAYLKMTIRKTWYERMIKVFSEES